MVLARVVSWDLCDIDTSHNYYRPCSRTTGASRIGLHKQAPDIALPDPLRFCATLSSTGGGMTAVFISHAKADKKLVDAFVDLLETGIGVSGRGRSIFASSVEGRDIPSSVDYRRDLKRRLKEAKITIFLVSPQFYGSSFCMAELGIAWGIESPSFVLLVSPLTRRRVNEFYGNLQLELLNKRDSLNKLCEYVQTELKLSPNPARWEAKRNEFLKRLPTLLVKPVRRSQATLRSSSPARVGYWTKRIVDGMLYIGNGFAVMDIKTALYKEIDRGRVLSPLFSYITNNGFHNWLALTEDPGYKYYQDAVKLFDSDSGSLVEIIKSAVGRKTPLDVISLGPGNGSKDRRFLHSLAGDAGAKGIFYYPFDVSSSMIATSMGAVGRDSTLNGIEVKAILADFDSLPEFRRLYQHRRGPNIFMLLGNTLGNLPDERRFLEQIHDHAMSPGDIFVLEVRNQKDAGVLGNDASNKRFDFGPLEYLGVAYDPAKLTYSPAEEDRSMVNGTQTTVAKYEDCRIENGENGEAENSDDESSDDEEKTVTLSYIHHYDPAKLTKLCEKVHFHVVDSLTSGSATALVLQKKR